MIVNNRMSKFLQAIRRKWYTFCCGVKNIIAWFPIVWRDDWIDFTYLLNMMEFKLRRDARSHRQWGVTVDSERIAEQMEEAADICFRIAHDVHGDELYAQHELKWGKLATWTIPADSPLLHKLCFYRCNANTEEERKQERTDVARMLEEMTRRNTADLKRLGEILMKVQYWWD